MVKEVTENDKYGIKVGGEIVSMIRYADDKAVVASSERNLQKLVISINKVIQDYSMKMNVKNNDVYIMPVIE